jgi:hypothetical protein
MSLKMKQSTINYKNNLEFNAYFILLKLIKIAILKWLNFYPIGTKRPKPMIDFFLVLFGTYKVKLFD